VKELIGTATAREQRTLASLADRLPHGDEQGS
jgi:hypothetical protein